MSSEDRKPLPGLGEVMLWAVILVSVVFVLALVLALVTDGSDLAGWVEAFGKRTPDKGELEDVNAVS